jgi:hypothetical protein
VAINLEGQDAPDHAPDGSPLLDDDFLVLVNAWWEPLVRNTRDLRGSEMGGGDRHPRPEGNRGARQLRRR